MPALETLVNNVRRNIFIPGTKVISMNSGGVPTKTAVAIGPYYSDIVNQITGKLKLL